MVLTLKEKALYLRRKHLFMQPLVPNWLKVINPALERAILFYVIDLWIQAWLIRVGSWIGDSELTNINGWF